jgi:hypothetical protein
MDHPSLIRMDRLKMRDLDVAARSCFVYNLIV